MLYLFSEGWLYLCQSPCSCCCTYFHRAGCALASFPAAACSTYFHEAGCTCACLPAATVLIFAGLAALAPFYTCCCCTHFRMAGCTCASLPAVAVLIFIGLAVLVLLFMALIFFVCSCVHIEPCVSVSTLSPPSLCRGSSGYLTLILGIGYGSCSSFPSLS
jgi:hypothetical protein